MGPVIKQVSSTQSRRIAAVICRLGAEITAIITPPHRQGAGAARLSLGEIMTRRPACSPLSVICPLMRSMRLTWAWNLGHRVWTPYGPSTFATSQHPRQKQVHSNITSSTYAA